METGKAIPAPYPGLPDRHGKRGIQKPFETLLN